MKESTITLSLTEVYLLLSLLPDWVKVVPKGLDSTFYGTCTYSGDILIKEKIDRIKERITCL